MVMVCMTWRKTFGNGVQIGMIPNIIATLHRIILKVLVLGVAVSYGVGLGVAFISINQEANEPYFQHVVSLDLDDQRIRFFGR